MLQRLLITFGSLVIMLACDMHDHEHLQAMPGVVVPSYSQNECLIACHKSQGEDVVIAGYLVVLGKYQDGQCIPSDFSEHVAEADSPYIAKCNELDTCKDSKECWPDSDTAEAH